MICPSTPICSSAAKTPSPPGESSVYVSHPRSEMINIRFEVVSKIRGHDGFDIVKGTSLVAGQLSMFSGTQSLQTKS